MHIHRSALLLAVALTLFTAVHSFITSLPESDPSFRSNVLNRRLDGIAQRTQNPACANLAKTVSGDITRHDPKSGIIWCNARTPAWIVVQDLQITQKETDKSIPHLLESALDIVSDHILQYGDGKIPGRQRPYGKEVLRYRDAESGFMIRVVNSWEDGATSWHVLKEAIEMLFGYFLKRHEWGPVYFWINDGREFVATGTLG